MKAEIRYIDTNEERFRWRACFVTGTRPISADILRNHFAKLNSANIEVVAIKEGFSLSDVYPRDIDLVIISINTVPHKTSDAAAAIAREIRPKVTIAKLPIKWGHAIKVLKHVGVLHENGTPLPPPRLAAERQKIIELENAGVRDVVDVVADQILSHDLLAKAILRETAQPGTIKGLKQKVASKRQQGEHVSVEDEYIDAATDIMALIGADEAKEEKEKKLREQEEAEEAELNEVLREIEEEERIIREKEEEAKAMAPKTELKLVPAQAPEIMPPPPPVVLAPREPSLLERIDAEIASMDDGIDEVEDEINKLHTEIVNANARKEMMTKRQSSLRTSREHVLAAMAIVESPRAEPSQPNRPSTPVATDTELRDAIIVILLDKQEGITGGDVRRMLESQQINYGPYNARVSTALRRLVDEGKVRCAISHLRSGYRYWLV
jgi:hypothetical protein